MALCEVARPRSHATSHRNSADGKPSTARNAKQTQNTIKNRKENAKPSSNPASRKTQTTRAGPHSPHGLVWSPPPVPRLASPSPGEERPPPAPCSVPSRSRRPAHQPCGGSCHRVRFGAAGHPGSATLEPSTGCVGEWVHVAHARFAQDDQQCEDGSGRGWSGFFAWVGCFRGCFRATMRAWWCGPVRVDIGLVEVDKTPADPNDVVHSLPRYDGAR